MIGFSEDSKVVVGQDLSKWDFDVESCGTRLQERGPRNTITLCQPEQPREQPCFGGLGFVKGASLVVLFNSVVALGVVNDFDAIISISNNLDLDLDLVVSGIRVNNKLDAEVDFSVSANTSDIGALNYIRRGITEAPWGGPGITPQVCGEGRGEDVGMFCPLAVVDLECNLLDLVGRERDIRPVKLELARVDDRSFRSAACIEAPGRVGGGVVVDTPGHFSRYGSVGGRTPLGQSEAGCTCKGPGVS